MLRPLLLTILGLFGLGFGWAFARRTGGPADGRTGGENLSILPSFHPSGSVVRSDRLRATAIGFATVFIDTLGIGCFATTTALFRATKLVPDELIPGTLNVGHALAAVVSAFIFIVLVPVDPTTLFSMIVAAGLGAWLGAGIVSRLPRARIQLGMGIALLFAAAVLLLTQAGLLPRGGEALGLTGAALGVAIVGNFLFGGLMTLGIGLYAPCMILISLLGLNPRTAFPIMMGSCAFLMPIAGVRFLREQRYHSRAALGLTIGGIPALLIAAFLVKALPLTALRWLVIVVVLYTGVTLLRAAVVERS